MKFSELCFAIATVAGLYLLFLVLGSGAHYPAYKLAEWQSNARVAAILLGGGLVLGCVATFVDAWISKIQQTQTRLSKADELIRRQQKSQSTASMRHSIGA